MVSDEYRRLYQQPCAYCDFTIWNAIPKKRNDRNCCPSCIKIFDSGNFYEKISLIYRAEIKEKDARIKQLEDELEVLKNAK